MAQDTFGGFYKRSRARYSYYSEKTTRVNSFIGWPSSKHQQPEDLAEAGFFYAGQPDCTRCFQCGLGLKNWLPGDSPFVEHARWQKNCEYVISKKGREFVDNVDIDYPRPMRNETDGAREDPIPKASDLEDMIKAVSQRPCGKALFALGFSSEIVRAAITSVLSSCDWDTDRVTSADLATIALDMEDKHTQAEYDKVANTLGTRFEGAVGGTVGRHSEAAEACFEFNTFELPERLAESGISTEISRLQEQNRMLEEKMKCKICLDNDVSVIFLPCGHLVTCQDCYSSLSRCPLCRGKIAAHVKAYL